MTRHLKISLWVKVMVVVVLSLAAGLAAWRWPGRGVKAAGTGTTALLTVQGSGAGIGNGEYVSETLNSPYRFFIEVPPGLDRLVVDIFDADVGMGGAAEGAAGRDRDRNGFNTSVRYSLIDPRGIQHNTQFTTGDASGPAGSDNAWLSLYDSTGDTVRDNFSTVAYSNNDGLMNWTTNWTETNDDNSPSAGLIQITGGELRIGDNGDANPSTIQREVNLSGSPSATLSFDCRTQGVESTDQISVQVSANGGGTWTTLETFTGSVSVSSRSYDISSSIASNTRVRFITVSGYGSNDFFFVDNLQIKVNGIEAGHWELRVDMSSAVTAGDDINAFGLRAHDGTSGAGGTELNVYVDSILGLGVNPPASGTTSRGYTFYPYLSSGCACSKNDFDYDSNSGDVGSMAFSSRTGGFTQHYASTSLSANDSWRRDSFSGWTSDGASADYGVWSANLTINSYLVGGTPNGNYANLYLGNYQAAANPPTANPVSNAFRLYLPNDAGTAPAKPYVEQRLIGPADPVLVGQTASVIVWVEVNNPTAQSITFSASNLVTVNVPGGGATYAGRAQVEQGSIVSQPAIGGTGNLTWNPGTIAAGARAVLLYYVNVTPTSSGQRIPVTATPASGNGTRARYVDETGNTTQTRATYQFGPLCELAVTQGTIGVASYPPGFCTLSALPNGKVGQPYDHQAGGSSLALISGSLPPGLMINAGHVTGTPTTAGTYSFTLTQGNPGLLCVGVRSYSVTISPASPSAVCSLTLWPTSASIPAGGGADTILVQTTLPDCQWRAASQAPWLTLTAGWSGTGTGAIAYQAAPNLSPGARTATIQVENQSFTVTQAGSCSYTLNPATSQILTSLGGSLRSSLQAGDGCPWAVGTSAPFVSFSPGAGSGPANIDFVVAPNPDSTSRTATITIGDQSLTVRQAAKFSDTPPSHPLFDYISRLSAAGISAGCGSGNFCPDAQVTREQMAVFIERSLGIFSPPTPTTQRFLDVPPSRPGYAYIDDFAARGITSGCGAGNYCPDASVTREQMAVFLVRALHAPGYLPAQPQQPRFADVPLSSPFAAYIEELAARGVTAGCGGGNYCPGAAVTRGQMAVFLVRAFNW